jgi:hypothetical protein
MDDLRDEQGAPSTERTIAAIDAVLADQPHWAKPDEKPATPRTPNLHNRAPGRPPGRRRSCPSGRREERALRVTSLVWAV